MPLNQPVSSRPGVQSTWAIGVPTYRADVMPYGGVKDSGVGREGPRYAIEEMTDERIVVFNL